MARAFTKNSRPVPIMLMARELGPGGTERQLTELARSLDPCRFEVHVGCFREGMRADELRRHRIPILRLDVKSLMKPTAAMGAWQLGSYLRKRGIRLVHTFDYPLNCFGVPVARASRVPIVLSSQRAHRCLTPPPYLQALRLTDGLVNGIIVNSESIQREMVRGEHLSASLVHVCYNGIDTARFHSDARRRVPALEDASLVIGVVCLLRPEKSVSTLVEAFAAIASRDRKLRLAIVGSGPELTHLATIACDLRISEQCLFQPTISDVAPWLKSIDIFVLPSISEGLSNSLMEAMACGCACIASRTGGNPELIRDGDTGLLFEPGNLRNLAEKLRCLLDSPGLLSRLADAGGRFIRESFSLASSVDRMQKIYESSLCKELSSSGR